MVESTRTTYGIKEEEMDFKEELDLSKIDDSLEAIQSSPINYVLGSFGKSFTKNERTSKIFFNSLQDDIKKFESELKDNPWYSDMQIVMLFKNILDKYFNWMTSQRQNIFLAEEKMKEVKDIVEKKYVSKETFDAEIEKYQLQIDEQFNDSNGVQVEIVKKPNSAIAVIPPKSSEIFSNGEKAILNKIKK